MRKRSSLCLLVSTLLWAAAGMGVGAELVVALDGSGTFRSVQRAIDASRPGDTILILPGVYEEVVSLRHGVTLRGSGSSITILRSAYGYDPVLRADGAGALRVEALTIERAGSILESMAVDLAATEARFRDCRISGGQIGGIRATAGSSLILEQCVVRSNGGYGVHASDGTTVRVHGGQISDNGQVGLHLADAQAEIEGVWIASEASGGLLLEGEASLEASQIILETAIGWGVRLLQRSTARLSDSALRSSGDGNVRAEGDACLTLIRCHLEGGRNGVSARGAARITAEGSSITRSLGAGVRCEESAIVNLTQCTVYRAGDDGVVGEDRAVLNLSGCTVAYNGGDGLAFHGDQLSAEHCIFAVNGGVGIRVDRLIAEGAAQLAYNNVWGNRGGEYLGIARPVSDLSVPPEFRDPKSGNLDLTSLSDCVASGAFGRSIGAGVHPLWSSTAGMGLSISQSGARWGAWELGLRWDSEEHMPQEMTARWQRGGEPFQAGLWLLWTGPRRLRAEGTVTAHPTVPWDVAAWKLLPAVRVEGVLDGAASRWGILGSLEFAGAASRIAVTSRVGGPRLLSVHTVTASFSGWEGWTQLHGGQVTGLRVQGAGEFAWPAEGTQWQLGLQAIPQWLLEGKLEWIRAERSFTVRGYSYPEAWSTWGGTFTWRHAGVRATVTYESQDGRFENLEIRVGGNGPTLSVSGALGASAAHGPRIRLDLSLAIDRWLAPPANQAPLARFTYSPDDPEAGERIRFDATASSDPDGALDQIWWSFGDGGMAEGAVVEHMYAQEGAYDVELTVSDDQGAVVSTAQTILVQPARTRPTAAFLWGPVSAAGTRLPRPARAGDRILLDASGSWDRAGSIVQYEWDLESDGSFDHTRDEPWLTIDPLPVGAWPVTLRVVNEAGFSDAVMYVLTIEPLRPPEAWFELSPSRPAVGDPIRFQDRSMAADGRLVSWEWSFGDGRASRDEEPLHRYAAPGEYRVRLTVRDAEGLSHTVEREVVVQANPERVQIQKIWAVLIGISQYEEVEGLDYARRDAEALADWLVERKVPSENIRLLTDAEGLYTTSSGVSLPMQPATLRNVRESLGWLRNVAEPEDLVIIHFSGHGYQGPAAGSDEADGLDEFFVLHDTRATAKEDTALRDDEFARFVDRIASNHVLIVFDSCYSGGLARSLPSPPAAARQPDVFTELRMEGRLVLSASTEDQEAFESHELQHGVFTHFLLEGLRGAADLNGDGHITVWELYGFVRESVPPFVAAERARVQVPQMIGSGETRVVLGRTPPDESPAFSYCPAVPVAGVAMSFRWEEEANLYEAQPTWRFGDGGTADGEAVSHTYADAGQYKVTLEIAGPGGTTQASERTVDVYPAASVVALTHDGLLILSVGRQNGVRVSDRFRLRAHDREDVRVEIVELLDEDRAVGRLLGEDARVEVGDRLEREDPVDAESCFTTP